MFGLLILTFVFRWLLVDNCVTCLLVLLAYLCCYSLCWFYLGNCLFTLSCCLCCICVSVSWLLIVGVRFVGDWLFTMFLINCCYCCLLC